MALTRMRQSGAFLSTSEGLILQLVGDAAHPQFKEVLASPPRIPCFRQIPFQYLPCIDRIHLGTTSRGLRFSGGDPTNTINL